MTLNRGSSTSCSCLHVSLLARLLIGFVLVSSFGEQVEAKGGLSPISILPKKGAYTWEAAMDRASGIATAKESAVVPSRSRLYKSLHTTKDRDLLPYAENLFSPYPKWLTRFPVTLGLLKAVPDKKGGFEIRDRIFGTNWLTFGKTQGQRLSFQSNSARGPLQTSQCTISIPITGGLLAMAAPKKPNSANRGSLLFTLTKSQEVGATGSTAGDSNSKTVCSITTAMGGYRPTLAGSAPCNIVRQWTYLGTQSLLHAGVMWRFQRRCWSMSTDKVFPETQKK